MKKAKKDNLSWMEKQIARIIAKKIYNQIKPYIDMKSWKTTLGGAIAALGAYLITVDEPAWVQIIGQIFIGLGPFIIGATARDNGITSEQAGAK